MRTLDQLINFPVDMLLGKRMDVDPTPEEQALLICAYAKWRWNDHTNYQPGDWLPLRFGYTFVEHRGCRWGIVHEAALLWIFKQQRKGSTLPKDGNEPTRA